MISLRKQSDLFINSIIIINNQPSIMLTILHRNFVQAAKGSTLKGSARKWMDRHVNDPYVKQAKIVRIAQSYY